MALFKIDDWYPDYKTRFFDGDDVKGADVYVRTNDGDEKVGSVHNILINEMNRICYLVIDTGFWVFGKKVLLPIGRCIDDPERDRIYTVGLTKEQVERLPEYNDDLVVDYDYEEVVRSLYRMPSVSTSAPVEVSAPVEGAGLKGYVASQPVASAPAPPVKPVQPATPAEAVDVYEREPDLYGMTDENHRRLRLYEERLVADKRREKTGGLTVTKRVETESADASVPVQKEKVVIEIESVGGSTRVNTPEGSFQEGEVARLDVYEEKADIRKEAVVRQEINIRKEVEQDIVTAHETLRREELDVQREGHPDVVDRT